MNTEIQANAPLVLQKNSRHVLLYRAKKQKTKPHSSKLLMVEGPSWLGTALFSLIYYIRLPFHWQVITWQQEVRVQDPRPSLSYLGLHFINREIFFHSPHDSMDGLFPVVAQFARTSSWCQVSNKYTVARIQSCTSQFSIVVCFTSHCSFSHILSCYFVCFLHLFSPSLQVVLVAHCSSVFFQTKE